MSLSQLAELTVIAIGMASLAASVLTPVLALIAFWAWKKAGKPTTSGTGMK